MLPGCRPPTSSSPTARSSRSCRRPARRWWPVTAGGWPPISARRAASSPCATRPSAWPTAPIPASSSCAATPARWRPWSASSRAWWCSVSPRHVIALTDAAGTGALRNAAGEAVRWTPGVTVTDLTPRYAALGLLGPATESLLDELSAGQLAPADEPAFDVLKLAAVPGMLLRTSRTRAVILTDAARASGLWMDIDRVGQDAGIGHVGADAVSHLSP